ncbi:flagellar hook-basal body complex protein [Gimibacter soli]|uniref:Flagellar hook-basal body complex protein n=1 Tax=Gimibacter soli TaxID=3024400 RepID=A0AAE9XQG5_9PROT|nr:flagellar hook-basal body complex protein [Gimibacter soli]WCL53035.1 flagellar hook-basal body complex protein [Gimibacter soli]
MDSTLYISLSHRMALRRRMDVAAHNVANMSTTAFKKERVAFSQYLMDAPGAEAATRGKIAYVLDHGVIRNLEIGRMVPTENPLDIYIDGKAYFSVQAQNGDTLYTRNGRMMVDADGELALTSGEKLLDDGGATIEMPDGYTSVAIAPDGSVSTNLGPIAKLQIAAFTDEQALQRRGSSLYETNALPMPVDDMPRITLIPKAVEESNVNPIESMMEVMEVLHAYEKSAKFEKDYQDMRKDALDRLARVQ